MRKVMLEKNLNKETGFFGGQGNSDWNGLEPRSTLFFIKHSITEYS